MCDNSCTIRVVGDSTVSSFCDRYYMPRHGYGEEIGTYFSASVLNLARSGASSKDFVTMPEYRTLMDVLGKGEGQEFLLIGFGHNDEKPEVDRYTDPNGDYRTPGSFAHSLYQNYVKPALERNVIPVVCTPVARLAGAKDHVTEPVPGYRGGDYRRAILDMAGQLNLQFIDLTNATRDFDKSMHAWTAEGKGLDTTHLNLYGAKLTAWLISDLSSKTAPELAQYSLNKERPTGEEFLPLSVNPDYVCLPYKAPTEAQMNASHWPVFENWHGTVFGEIEDLKNYKASVAGDSITLESAGGEGLFFYYMRLPANSVFTVSARAKANSLGENSKVSYGLMVRDDLYVDTYASPTGDFVAAACLNQGRTLNYGQKSGSFFGEVSSKPSNPKEVELKIVANREGYALSFGDKTDSAGFDYPLTATDNDYVYAGFFVTGKADVTFSEIKLWQHS